jgi:ribosomal-protein-alanine N-acetyltransferase
MASQTRVRITPGGLSDLAAVEALSQRAFDPAFREGWTARQLAQIVGEPGGVLLLARIGEELAGFALLRVASDSAELLLCATEPAHRREGIASELVAACRAGARRLGATHLFLEVRESNLAARRLYQRVGFQSVGIRPGYYTSVTGERLAALTLRLSLMD